MSRIAAEAAAAEEIAEQATEREAAEDAAEHSPATSLLCGLRRLCSVWLRRRLLRRLRRGRRHVALRADRAAAAEPLGVGIRCDEARACEHHAYPK